MKVFLRSLALDLNKDDSLLVLNYRETMAVLSLSLQSLLMVPLLLLLLPKVNNSSPLLSPLLTCWFPVSPSREKRRTSPVRSCAHRRVSKWDLIQCTPLSRMSSLPAMGSSPTWVPSWIFVGLGRSRCPLPPHLTPRMAAGQAAAPPPSPR